MTAAPPASRAAMGIAPAKRPLAAFMDDMDVPMAPAMRVVLGFRPEVKGASWTGVAPEKAGAWVVEDGSGMTSVAMGLRTLEG